ncbi:hypothetical protein FRC07_011345, partial [Ceratobasidium sp. 392]
ARRAWANNLKSEWERRGAHEAEDRFDKQGNLKAKPTPKGPEEMIEKKQAAANRKSKKRGGRRGDMEVGNGSSNARESPSRSNKEHSVDPPAGPPPPAPSPAPASFRPAYPQPGLYRSYSYAQRYRPASSENIAATAQAAARRHAEEMRLYQEHMEEIKYQERQAARAARGAREAAAARKAFEEERKRLDEQRRKAEEEKRKNEERQLTFYDIPWPVAMPARSFDELQASAIERFLLSPYHSTSKTRKMRLRAALMQWHPDKFAQRFVDRIEESHRNAILAAVNSVARTITELMNDSD